ncbi:MAG: AAA family ATPase, partial [Bacteroidota bacterium]
RQHSSVVRGDALRILNTIAGIRTAEVSKIYRQKNEDYRKVVEELSKGNVKQAFEKLDSMGAIKDVDPIKPNETLIKDFLEVIKKKKTALIISPTHAQGESLTKELRNKLRADGLIGKKEIAVARLTNLNLTEAEKKDWRNLKKGLVVQFNQNVSGVNRGSQLSIEDVSEFEIKLKNSEGLIVALPITKLQNIDVYKKNEIALSKGDKINITRNSFDKNDKRLNNGQNLEVASFDKSGNVVVRNAKSKNTYSLPQDFGHISYAYCVTSHASQGKTVDEVFISQPASTFPATDAKQFYVSVSRARNKVHIYTDDKASLLEYASQIGDRQSAIELVSKNDSHQKFVEQVIREKNQEAQKIRSSNIERSKENISTSAIKNEQRL